MLPASLCAASLFLAAVPVRAETVIRVATLNSGLERRGPGLLLRDILSGQDEQVLQVRDLIRSAAPDILLLTNFDHDLGLVALRAFNDLLREAGGGFDHVFALAPNTGMATGLDLDNDGWLGGARDAQGYGEFAGQGGLALLSRYPVDTAAVRDFSELLWKDLPGSDMPATGPDKDAARILRLSSVAHWDVPVLAPCRPLRLLAYHATTPAFDGPEHRNSRRNRAQNLFWLDYLDGKLAWPAPTSPFVLLGDANLDPADGKGDTGAVRKLLADARLQDPAPRSERGVRAARAQGGANRGQAGDPALDTADWRDEGGPGNLRVDYVLPAAGLEVRGSGLVWADESAEDPSVGREGPVLRHALVWVDILWEAGSECVD